MDKITICVIGFGSIAKRHIENIVSILKSRNIAYTIDLYRSGKGQLELGNIEKNINKVCYDKKELLNKYDIMFITNPTNLHYSTLKEMKNKAKNFFIEKPIFDNENENIDLLKLEKNSVYYVACPLRYTRMIEYLKENIKVTDIYNARIICSSYLPEWRKGVDYRNTYSSHKNQGGGVDIDLIHEWDYICYLFGTPKNVKSFKGKYSNLEIDSNDIAIYIAEYEDKLVELHLDYFGRVPKRIIELYLANEVIVVDLYKATIYYEKENRTISLKEERNDYQKRELEYFLDIVYGKKENINDINKALEILKLTQK